MIDLKRWIYSDDYVPFPCSMEYIKKRFAYVVGLGGRKIEK